MTLPGSYDPDAGAWPWIERGLGALLGVAALVVAAWGGLMVRILVALFVAEPDPEAAARVVGTGIENFGTPPATAPSATQGVVGAVFLGALAFIVATVAIAGVAFLAYAVRGKGPTLRWRMLLPPLAAAVSVIAAVVVALLD